MSGSQGMGTLAPAANGAANQNIAITAQPTNMITPEDQELFSDPTQLFGNDLLDLATRHSTSSIAKHANEAAGRTIITSAALNSRLHAALQAVARNTGQTAEELRSELTEIRKQNGVKSRGKIPARKSIGKALTKEDESQNTGDTTEEEYEDVDGTAPANNDVEEQNRTVPGTNLEDIQLPTNLELLNGETLIQLAEKGSNSDIPARLGKVPGSNFLVLKPTAVYSRFTRALEVRAKATGLDMKRLRDDLANVRKANGVDTRGPSRIRFQLGAMAQDENVAEDAQYTGETAEEYFMGTDVAEGGDWSIDRALDAANFLPSVLNDPEAIEVAMILLEMASGA